MRLLIALLLPAIALAQAVPETLTLELALQLAAENRAESVAANYSVEAQQHAVRQADRAPNPVLLIQTENWRPWGDFRASTDLDAFVSVSQRVELSGKRRFRTEAAQAETGIARAERDLLRWHIANQVTTSWWAALRAQEEAALIEESLQAVEDLVRYHEVRWREGEGAEMDLIKVRVELEKERRRLVESEIIERSAKRAVSAEIGTPMPSTVRLVRPTADVDDDPQVTVASAISQRPDLRLVQARAVRDEARSEVERSSAAPDLTPYIGYKRTNGFNTLIGGVAIPLNFRDRNKGAIAQAVAQAGRQRQLARAMEIRVRSEVDAALAERGSRRDAVQSLSSLIDDATEAHDVALAAYREGGVELLYVIDSQRTLNETKLLGLQVDFDYQLSRAEVQRVSGIAPRFFVSTNGSTEGVR